MSLFLTVVLYSISSAQETDRDQSDDPVIQSERPKFTPFIAPAYTPEVEFMLTLGGLFTFKTKPMDPYLQRSSIPFSVGYSTNGTFNANFRPYIIGTKDKMRVFGDIWFKDMPDNYWGVGYTKGKRVSKPDSTTKYHRKWWQIYMNVVFRLKPESRIFIGGNVDLNETRPTKINEYMRQDPYVIESGSHIRNSGLGFILQYDTRDNPINSYSGIFISLTSTFYGNFLNGKNRYNLYQLDYRQFLQIRREGRTLAWQVKNRFGDGDIPWTEMSQLGNPFDLRGYRWGRFRDVNMLFGIVEYRHMFLRKKPNKKGSYKSRSGFVTWIATGTISPTRRSAKNWLPNAGIGYRFEVQPRMNARLDFGIGEDTSSFYISFNEAF